MLIPLQVAAWCWEAGDDPLANAAAIRRAIALADAEGAKVLVTPECVLTGYPSAGRRDLAGIDWAQIADLEDSLLLEAKRRGMLLVLGSAAQAGDEGKATNELVAGGCVQPMRLSKRQLTPIDQPHFVPGPATTPVVHAHGWTFGLSICYEVRFPDIWRDQAAAGADAFLHVAHMAGPDPDPGTKAEVIPSLYATRAAEWATPLIVANTAAADRYLDGGVWDARGVRIASVNDGLALAALSPRESLAPWYGELRRQALAGRAAPT